MRRVLHNRSQLSFVIIIMIIIIIIITKPSSNVNTGGVTKQLKQAISDNSKNEVVCFINPRTDNTEQFGSFKIHVPCHYSFQSSLKRLCTGAALRAMDVCGVIDPKGYLCTAVHLRLVNPCPNKVSRAGRWFIYSVFKSRIYTVFAADYWVTIHCFERQYTWNMHTIDSFCFIIN